MNIKITEGCVCYSYEVDGKDFDDLPLETKRKLCHALVDMVEDNGELLDIVANITRHYGKHKFLGVCDECGDGIDQYTLKIP